MPIVEEVCTITAKGQTTLPRVRQALGVGYGGRIAFRVEGIASSFMSCRRTIDHDKDSVHAFTQGPPPRSRVTAAAGLLRSSS